MNKILGVIAEYNPFHNGHLYHLQKSKEITNADYVVCVMSGNFVQRGETSLTNKWTKTEMALQNGVDLVIELPLLYAISSAENFAYGAVSILNSLGFIDYISFGSECGDITTLSNIANLLNSEPNDYKIKLAEELKNGISFPKAREHAIASYFNNTKITKTLSSSNNILGIEYLKALKKSNSKIEPVTIIRNSVDYNEMIINNNIASATGIREMLKNNKLDLVKYVVPNNVFEIINDSDLTYDINCFEKEIIYILRRMSLNDIQNLPDVSEGLENTIKKAVNSSNNLIEIISKIKSKRYTQTRIQRILLYALLCITKKDIVSSTNTTPYARILGFNENGKNLLSKIQNENVITSVKKFLDTTSSNELKNMLEKDILATNIYTLSNTTNPVSNLDYTQKVIEIKGLP